MHNSVVGIITFQAKMAAESQNTRQAMKKGTTTTTLVVKSSSSGSKSTETVPVLAKQSKGERCMQLSADKRKQQVIEAQEVVQQWNMVINNTPASTSKVSQTSSSKS